MGWSMNIARRKGVHYLWCHQKLGKEIDEPREHIILLYREGEVLRSTNNLSSHHHHIEQQIITKAINTT